MSLSIIVFMVFLEKFSQAEVLVSGKVRGWGHEEDDHSSLEHNLERKCQKNSLFA